MKHDRSDKQWRSQSSGDGGEIKHEGVGQPIAARLVVSRWLPVLLFKVSESLMRYF